MTQAEYRAWLIGEIIEDRRLYNSIKHIEDFDYDRFRDVLNARRTQTLEMIYDYPLSIKEV